MDIELMEFLYTLSLNQKILIIHNGHAICQVDNVYNIIEQNYLGHGNNIVKLIDIDSYSGGLGLLSPTIKYLKIYIE